MEEAPFALLSHGTESDPIFNYGNRLALQLFESTFEALTRMPSRLSAETPLQSEREALLREVSEKGFIDHYSGVRISTSGRRFRICNATVWNVHDASGNKIGQAAAFSQWEPVA
jgi:hypothetical protein